MLGDKVYKQSKDESFDYAPSPVSQYPSDDSRFPQFQRDLLKAEAD